MALRLPDRWLWDFWVADTGAEYHVFYLQASRALDDPELRHQHASIGHAVSTDLRNWELLPDAVRQGDTGSWDDRSTWTGSVIERDGRWHLLYTGTTTAEDGRIQRIGLASSDDLITWTKHNGTLIEADDRWYERYGDSSWPEEAWRDPWVFEENGRYHALITARANTGPVDARGVIGHATSPDLTQWEVCPPLSEPGDFAQLEVPQIAHLNDEHVLVFSCDARRISARRRARLNDALADATYVVSAPSALGRFNIARAEPALPEHLYSGRLIPKRDGSWTWLAFINTDANGRFVGELTDPIPISTATLMAATRGRQ